MFDGEPFRRGCSANSWRVDELGLDSRPRSGDELDYRRHTRRLEVGEGTVTFSSEPPGALQRHEPGRDCLADSSRMVCHVLADVVQALAVLGKMIGKDARALEGLDELELDLSLPGEGVAKGELDLSTR